MKVNLKNLATILVFVLGLIFSSSAQEFKMGYANIEGLIAYMPETSSMNQSLATYEKKMAEELQLHQNMLQQLYADYQETAQKFQEGTGTITEVELKTKQDEIVKLEKELQEKTQKAQERLLAKRQKLMEPILDKVRGELEELANDKGYTYIFNAVDGSGTSIILHGPESDNLTRELANRLGINLPDVSE